MLLGLTIDSVRPRGNEDSKGSMFNAPPALRTFTDCLRPTSIGRLQYEFFPPLSPVQNRPRFEMVRADHVSDLPELSQLSGYSGSSQADPECVGRLARRLESAYFPVVIRSCTAAPWRQSYAYKSVPKKSEIA